MHGPRHDLRTGEKILLHEESNRPGNAFQAFVFFSRLLDLFIGNLLGTTYSDSYRLNATGGR